MNGYRDAMRRAGPAYFVDCAPWQHERGTGLRTKASAFSGSQNLVPNRPAQHDVHKVLDVLMLGNDTSRNAVILHRQTAPFNSRTA
jgi:hypothetical protein